MNMGYVISCDPCRAGAHDKCQPFQVERQGLYVVQSWCCPCAANWHANTKPPKIERDELMNFLRRSKRTPTFPPAKRTKEEWETLRRYLILRGANPHLPDPEIVAPGYTFDPGVYPGATGSAPTVTLTVKVKVPDEFVRESRNIGLTSGERLHAGPVDLCCACSKHANSHN